VWNQSPAGDSAGHFGETYNPGYCSVLLQAVHNKQKVLYVTERAVFKLTAEGLELLEVAPGIDMNSQVLRLMDFKPIVNNVKLMTI